MEIQNQKQIMQDEALRQLCLRAVQEEDALLPALEGLYRAAFADTPQLPEAEQVFARRAVEMQAELRQQLEDGWQDPFQWLNKQLEECPVQERTLMTSALCALAAEWQLPEAESRDLCLALETVAQRPDRESLEMLEAFAQTPLEGPLTTLYRYPLMDEDQRRRAACLLAMVTYIDLKAGGEEAAADISFDAVCLLAGTLVEVMGRSAESVPEKTPQGLPLVQVAAAVFCVLGVQYLWLDSLVLLVRCMQRLRAAIQEMFRQLKNLTRDVESKEGTHIRPRGVKEPYDFIRSWQPLLPQQMGQEAEADTKKQKQEQTRTVRTKLAPEQE